MPQDRMDYEALFIFVTYPSRRTRSGNSCYRYSIGGRRTEKAEWLLVEGLRDFLLKQRVSLQGLLIGFVLRSFPFHVDTHSITRSFLNSTCWLPNFLYGISKIEGLTSREWGCKLILTSWWLAFWNFDFGKIQSTNPHWSSLVHGEQYLIGLRARFGDLSLENKPGLEQFVLTKVALVDFAEADGSSDRGHENQIKRLFPGLGR